MGNDLATQDSSIYNSNYQKTNLESVTTVLVTEIEKNDQNAETKNNEKLTQSSDSITIDNRSQPKDAKNEIKGNF